MDTSADTKTCTTCGRVLPTAESGSKTLVSSSECPHCAWERLCRTTEVDLDRTAHRRPQERANPVVVLHSYRRYSGKNRDKILGRLRRRFASDQRQERLLAQAEAGYVEFAVEMRRRRAGRHGAGGSHTNEDVLRLYGERRGRCFYCQKELNGTYGVGVDPLWWTLQSLPLKEVSEKMGKVRGAYPKEFKEQMTAEEFMEYLTNLQRGRPRLP